MSSDVSLEVGLRRASGTLEALLERARDARLLDVTDAPGGSAALWLSRLQAAREQPLLVITADAESARQCAQELAFFLGEAEADQVLRYPASEVSPFLQVAPDRRSAMDRLATLSRLASGQPWRLLVAPVSALMRRVMPREEVLRRSRSLEVGGRIDQRETLRALVAAGYMRVPVVEDPGTFASRGGLLDVFPAGDSQPVRVELDDEEIVSLRRFDAESQRSGALLRSVQLQPVRETAVDPDQKAVLRERIQALCDLFDIPSRKRNALLDDLEQERAVLGIDALLPAFHPQLETLFDFLPEHCPVALMDPTAISQAASRCHTLAENDRAARITDGPAFELSQIFLDELDLAEAIERRPALRVHRLGIRGRPGPEENPLEAMQYLGESPICLGAESQEGLIAERKNQQQKLGRMNLLDPLARRASAWLEQGFRVLLVTRGHGQAERLRDLLASHDLPVNQDTPQLDLEQLQRLPAGALHVVVGKLERGFIAACAGLCCVSDQEIFGTRQTRVRARRKATKHKTQAFLEDLRALQINDFVVHEEHGVGRYLGLERKQMGLSKYDRMQGVRPIEVEALVVQYEGGKLFLPVTRLNQVQKHSAADGKAPKLDRLGGQTFSRTKQRVRGQVRQLADDLLGLYAQRAARSRPSLPPPDRNYAEFETSFQYEETQDQARAIEDVLSDLSAERAMDRVVCGDVGFGKTEVALRAAFQAALHGRQVALLCPTTVLAQQHYQTFLDRLDGYPLEVGLLSRFVTRKEQRENLDRLKRGTLDIVVGTHRLLSKDVRFKQLGLLVVDEEQRFGVAHKERIKTLRSEVDVLTLSATPIPRTLQLAMGGLRDLSLITTPPVDRRAIRTFVTRWDEHVIREAIQRELKRGGQVFFVHNRIESLYERSARLAALVPEARIATAHGQLKESLLERTMGEFVDGQHDVLCSTAIVENGLDIPRANTILIDRANHYGLSQLYQLRGRVGRSRERAYCYLIAPPPDQLSEEARTRLEALTRFTELGSGFKLASLDMELRGTGDLLGAEQHGNVSAVGFDLFVRMLEEAIAELKGEAPQHEVDTELSMDIPLFLPEDYIEEVGVRLSLYKRFASAGSEDEISELATEMEDRFGAPPDEALIFVRAMNLKPALRALRVLACEATASRVSLHLRDDTPLDGISLLGSLGRGAKPLRLTPDQRLVRHFDPQPDQDCIDRIHQLLRELQPHIQAQPAPSNPPENPS